MPLPRSFAAITVAYHCPCRFPGLCLCQCPCHSIARRNYRNICHLSLSLVRSDVCDLCLLILSLPLATVAVTCHRSCDLPLLPSLATVARHRFCRWLPHTTFVTCRSRSPLRQSLILTASFTRRFSCHVAIVPVTCHCSSHLSLYSSLATTPAIKIQNTLKMFVTILPLI